MAEIPPNQGSKTLKVVLFVALGLVGLCVVCGVGSWFLFGRQIAGLAMPVVELQGAVNQKYGNSASFELAGTSPEDFTLALGIPGERTPEETAAAQDWLWTTYAKAFSAGGFPVRRLAVGTPRGSGKVRWDEADEVAVEDVIARTNTPAPPVNELLAEEMKGNGVKVRIGSKDDDASGGDQGGEQKQTDER
jgi:hypothetical protein